ncbi:hypothetical protein FA13DRAFT_1719142 [Coprinellus micaceus]|uniref:Uncharacterized protein n=1 Tax=Coprinellus micaceus TaxID=71717 RepID=A0A4Y7SBQ6_COPMI|nr:hypothetical protein FA13DRAFT_1719142 [Coprinellus micaceus]
MLNLLNLMDIVGTEDLLLAPIILNSYIQRPTIVVELGHRLSAQDGSIAQATMAAVSGGFGLSSRLPVEVRSNIFHLSHNSWCSEALASLEAAKARVTPTGIETSGDADGLLLARTILDHHSLYGNHLRGSPFHTGEKATFHPLHALRIALAGTVMSEEENHVWASTVCDALALVHPENLTILTNIVDFHHIVLEWPIMPMVLFLKVDFECPVLHMFDPEEYEIGEQSDLEDYAWNQPEWGDMLSKFPHITEFYLRTTSGLDINEYVDNCRDRNVPPILTKLKENCLSLEKVSIEAWGWCGRTVGNVAQRRHCYQYKESSGEWECVLSGVEVPWREPILLC